MSKAIHNKNFDEMTKEFNIFVEIEFKNKKIRVELTLSTFDKERELMTESYLVFENSKINQ